MELLLLLTSGSRLLKLMHTFAAREWLFHFILQHTGSHILHNMVNTFHTMQYASKHGNYNLAICGIDKAVIIPPTISLNRRIFWFSQLYNILVKCIDSIILLSLMVKWLKLTCKLQQVLALSADSFISSDNTDNTLTISTYGT